MRRPSRGPDQKPTGNPHRIWNRSRSAIDSLKSFGSASLLDFAARRDVEFAEEARKKGCPHCRGPLHYGRYFRKFRPLPDCEPPEGWALFASLCCSRKGCRRRVRPLSLRYAGRSPHSVAMLLLCRFLKSGGSQKSTSALCSLLGISPRTVGRRLGLWRAAHSRSVWWRKIASRFGLHGKTLVDLYDTLLGLHQPKTAIELLLTECAQLWTEIRIIDREDAPAKQA